MHFDVPDLRPIQLGDLSRPRDALYGLVEADGSLQRPTQPRVSDQLVGRERLFDVQQPRLVEQPQVALVNGPVVGPVGVDGERDVRPRHPLAGRSHGGLVPPRRHLDLDPPVALSERVVHVARERGRVPVFGDPQRHTARHARRRPHAESLGEELGQSHVAPSRFQVPRGGLDARARERIAAHPLAERRVHLLGRGELPTHDARDEDAPHELGSPRERLLRVERQLEWRRFPEPGPPVFIVEHDDERATLRHRPARDHERLEQRQRQLEQLSAGDTHRAQDRESATPRCDVPGRPDPRAPRARRSGRRRGRRSVCEARAGCATR